MHIVLVEPSSIGRRIIARMLEGRGHRVEAFENGARALRFIQDTPSVDVVLTSFETDGISGTELCWECRLIAQEGRLLYIIAMSSGTETSKVIEALDCGADDFIRKPPVPEELFARLRAAERLSTMHKELVSFATCDELTGLLNRRAFFEAAERSIGDALTEMPISAIMLDIDHFKRINDTYGHLAGDAVIKAVGEFIARQSNIVGRLGGEEFAILLPGRKELDAYKIAECLRFEIAGAAISADDETIHITASLGVAEISSNSDISLTDLLKRADAALYEAKKAGRNRVHRPEDDIIFAVV
ncbi:diguanylate cyclase [Rhizobiales bacterium]|uniref:GGDEF domain-containing response regulator n=1 Tax=Hongsoonwoonella zoysiae TaxID=2821844 RepID=UPI00155FA174|nr:diguanylate cyclase [Hongsoonwoonella zoysiae]NRG19977.1 diguanylate cyclase [Hongsoonwoonella zoysiae]